MIKREEIFSIPNILSYIRIILIPVFLYTYFYVESSRHYMSGGILVVSSFTDFLDGYIARHYNMITNLGKFVDPLADKLTQITVALTLVHEYPFYILLVIIILIKDGMLLLVGAYLLKKYNTHLNQADMPGKIATAVFFVISVFMLIFSPAQTISRILIVLTTALMFIAMVHYARELYGLKKAV